MTLDLRRLFHIQEQLDHKISKTHGLTDQPLLEPKLLALQVELGELANETRCFKYWSLKPPAARETILEEYVDGLHFVLSIGLEQGYEGQIGEKEQMIELMRINDATEAFLQLYQDISHFAIKQDIAAYTLLLESFLQLGATLGFTSEEMMEAYLDKNKVNHQRQAEGY
jgi:dimeric dUTPase (all-alpha-NTP-PPase superfamily)